MRTVRGIPADEINALWSQLEPLISRALKYSPDYTLDEIHQSLLSQHRQCFVTWPELDTICVTAIETRPAAKVLVIWWKAGKLHEDWREMLEATEGWGRWMGCSMIEFRGRKGWERLLPDYQTTTLYRKDLT